MKNIILLGLCVLACVKTSTAVYGIDLSAELCANTDASTWQCLAQQGYSFAIIQGWQGGYGLNTNLAACVANAWAAGFAHVDVYIFFCPECSGNSESSPVDLLNYMSQNNVQYGMLWFDIEQCDGCWDDAGSNANFIAAGVQNAQNAGAVVGMYSSEYEWGATVGGYSGLSNLPLWYAHYDGNPSFSDGLYQFGGWTSPAIKQYDDNGGACGTSYDLNWYPDSFFANRTYKA
eukprot:TRINITY_DN439_c0_g1_i1.p1 TRINITY_DN439_c0_g1~~TRINITY_DN439_c0_g1_i1.p1  ORF type:complete len:232 (-),score=68.24 TRINITY_DN439_c0_g1_i1:49-744(-)